MTRKMLKGEASDAAHGRLSRYRRVAAICVLQMMVMATSSVAAKNFENVPWGSSPEQIEERFGEVALRDDETCDDAAATAARAEQGEDCLSVRIDYHFVDGISFAVSFRFDSEQRGLRMVVLKSALKSKNLNPNAVKRVLLECRQNYEKLARRLTREFGTPSPEVAGEPEPTFTKADLKAWRTEGTGVWMRKSYGYTDHWKRRRKAEGCEIELRYFSIPVAGPEDAQ